MQLGLASQLIDQIDTRRADWVTCIVMTHLSEANAEILVELVEPHMKACGKTSQIAIVGIFVLVLDAQVANNARVCVPLVRAVVLCADQVSKLSSKSTHIDRFCL